MTGLPPKIYALLFTAWVADGDYVSVGFVGAANGHGDAGKGASGGAPL
jgi:hypothetical protein